MESFVETYTKVEEWRKIDTTHGDYMSASRVFQAEGGTTSDIEPTKLLLKKCTEMGPPFVKYNDFTERYDYLYLRQEWKEELSKSWKMFKEADATGGVKRKVDGESTTPKDGVVTPAPKKKVKVEQTITPDKQKELAENKKAANKIISEAIKVKSKHFRVVKSAEDILSNIANDASWKWADSAAGELRKAYEQVRTSATDFYKQFHSLDLDDLKKQLPPDTIIKNCQMYTDDYEPKLDELLNQARKLMKMHLIHKTIGLGGGVGADAAHRRPRPAH